MECWRKSTRVTLTTLNDLGRRVSSHFRHVGFVINDQRSTINESTIANVKENHLPPQIKKRLSVPPQSDPKVLQLRDLPDLIVFSPRY